MAEDNQRKRKRQSNGVQSSAKKVALQDGDTDSIKIRWKEHSGLHPVVLSSPGLLAPSLPFDVYSKPLTTGSGNKSSPTPSNHELLLHSSKHPRLDYTAASVPLDAEQSHYVGIYDPASKNIQILPAHHLGLRSSVRSEPKDAAQERRTIAQQREELGREFGTKKAKKAIDAKTVNAIAPSAGGKDGVSDAILDMMAGSALPTLDEKEQLQATLKIKPIPQPDLDATEVEDVYPFDTLIPPADARLLTVKEWQESARNDEEIDGFSHIFPASRVAVLGKGEDVLRLKALSYINLLLRFNSALQNAGRAGKKVPKKEVLEKQLPGYPEPLVASVRRRFATQQNEMPKWNMDNLYTHICALTLYIDGWATDMTHLKTDLKMENKELMVYYRELGCKVGPPSEGEKESLNRWFATRHNPHKSMSKGVAAATRVAKLRIPPDFPKPKSGRKR